MQASIELKVGFKGERSFVRSLYVTPPFRLVSVGQLKRDGACYLMQMSTSPGVLSGDRYDIKVEVESGGRVQLLSQSYQRLFDMDGEAEQVMSIKLGDNAHFSQVPHPIVPHRNSSYSSSSRVEMGCNSSFLQSEIITCGRKYHGEEFAFRCFSNSVEIYSQGVLRFRDKIVLNPSLSPLMECGLLEGYTHQGTLIFQTSEQCDTKAIIESIYAQLAETEDVRFGISQTHYPGFILRILGNDGEKLFNIFTSIQENIWYKRV
ncbi:MAG: urease accessory protein UreD [Rikenellaceae bacterium]